MTTAIATQDEVRESAAQALAQAALAARQAGFTRPELAQLTGLTTAQVWRVEQGRVHADEFDAVDAVMAKIAQGELQPAKAQRVEPRQAKINAALEIFKAVEGNATKAQLWGALVAMRDALHAPSLEDEVQ
jgi:transcriptional regulator with XRE-family HTH domain